MINMATDNQNPTQPTHIGDPSSVSNSNQSLLQQELDSLKERVASLVNKNPLQAATDEVLGDIKTKEQLQEVNNNQLAELQKLADLEKEAGIKSSPEDLKKKLKKRDEDFKKLGSYEGPLGKYLNAFNRGADAAILGTEPSVITKKDGDFLGDEQLEDLGYLAGEIAAFYTPGGKIAQGLGFGKAVLQKTIKKGLTKAIFKEGSIDLAKKALRNKEILELGLTGLFSGTFKGLAQGKDIDEAIGEGLADSIILPGVVIPTKMLLKSVGNAIKGKVIQEAKDMAPSASEGLKKIDEFIGLGSSKESLRKSFKDQMVDFETMYIDRYAPLRAFQGMVYKNTGKTVPIEDAPFEAARLYSGHYRKIENHIKKQLSPILKPVKDLTRPLKQLLAAERIQEDLMSGKPVGKFSVEDVLQATKELKATLGDDFIKVETAANQLRGYMNSLLKSTEGHFLKVGGSAEIIAKNQKYLPFKYLEKTADDVFKSFGGKKLVVGKSPIKGKVGTLEDYTIEDPLGAIIGKAPQIITALEKNKVMQKFVKLREIDPEFEKLIVPVTDDAAKSFVGKSGKISAWFNGEKKDYLVPKGIEEMFKGLNEPTFDFATKWARSSSKFLRMGATTLNPSFNIRNTVRDFSSQAIKAKYPVGPIGWLKGFFHSVKGMTVGDELFDQMIKENALTGGIGLIEKEQRFLGSIIKNKGNESILNADKAVKKLTDSTIKKVAKTILNPVELMETISSAVELAPRAGVFSNTLKSTNNPLLAAWESRNSTIDFTKSGLKTQVANAFVPFLNARMQGTINMYTGLKEHPLRSSLLMAGTAGVPTILSYVWNTRQYGDLDRLIPEYEKKNNHIIITGTTEEEGRKVPTYIKIPKDEPGKIFGNMLQEGLKFLDSKDSKAVDQLFLKFVDDNLPIDFTTDEGEFSSGELVNSTVAALPIVKGAVEYTTGTDMRTGKPTEGKFGLPGWNKVAPELRYTDKTGSVAKFLGDVFNASPIRIQRLARTLGGFVGDSLMGPENVVPSLVDDFVGHRDNAMGALAFKELEKIQGIVQTEKRKDEIQAEVLVTQARKLPPGEGLKLLKDAWQGDKDLEKAVKKSLRDDRTLIDKAIEQTRVKNGERAALLHNILKSGFGEGEAEQKKAFLKDLMTRTDSEGNKLVTTDVLRQMQKIKEMKAKKKLEKKKK